MPSRNELNSRARALGLDPSTYANDSKLEQKILYLEKNSTAFTGTVGSGTLTSDATAQSNNDKVTIGDITYTFKTALTEAKATQTLTSDATAPSDGDTVTIEGQTYTFKTTLSSPAVAYEVLIGASAAAALDNLKQAINQGDTEGAGEGEGTNYGTGTVFHPLVTATTNTNTTQVVEARRIGTYANRFMVAETSSHLSWGAATLTGGAESVAYEVLLGANAAAMLDNLKLAINAGTNAGEYSTITPAHPQVTATTNTDTTQVVETIDKSVTNASIATTDPTDTGNHMSWGAATLASGVASVVAAAGAGTRDTNAGIAGDKNV